MRLVAAIAALALVTGCAGKTANPVPESQIGDSDMTCEEISAEMAHIKNRVAVLTPETKKGLKNTALGVTGIFLIVPWFFMDLSDAEKVEIQAYQERGLKLQRIAARKKCGKVDTKTGSIM